MLECCSIVTCCILSAIMLLIADSCHSCFACHLQTVHPFSVIFISISTKIISSFQWHAWFAKLLPCSSFSFQNTHMHRISYLAYHTRFASCCLCISRDWLWYRCFCSCFGWSQETSSWTRNLLSTLTRIKLSTTLRTLQARWPYPRNHFYLCFASCSLYYHAPLPITCYIMPPILPCQPLTILS